MNFSFKIMAHGFEKAGKLEAALKELGIPYDVSMAKSLNDKTRRTRTVIDKAQVMAVSVCISEHPGWTINSVAKETGVSRATVGRIKNGTHVLLPAKLQKKVA